MVKGKIRIPMRAIKVTLFGAIVFGIYILLKDVDFERIVPILLGMDFKVLSFVFVLGFVNLFLISVRWYVLLRVMKSDISYRNVLNGTIGAIAINASGPGKLGMPAKALYIKKTEKLEFNQSIPSITMELFLEIFGLFVLMVVGALAIGFHNHLIDTVARAVTYRSLFSIGIPVVLVIGAIYLFRRKLAENSFAAKLSSAFRQTVRRKDIFLLAMMITFVNLVISYWGDMLLFKALGQDIRYGFIVFTSAFASLAGMLSPLPSGIGVWELSRAYFFETYYNIAELAVIMTLMRRLLTYIAMGGIYLVNALFLDRLREVSFSEVARDQALESGMNEIDS